MFLAVSDFIRGKLLEQNVAPEKVIVHYIGVDTRFFSPAGVEAEPIVLFVGRLSERKGPSYLIQAMAEVQKEFPQVELVLIGDGPLRKSLEQQAKSSLKKYRFLGAQSPETIREWMDRASVFSASSVKIDSGEKKPSAWSLQKRRQCKNP